MTWGLLPIPAGPHELLPPSTLPARSLPPASKVLLKCLLGRGTPDEVSHYCRGQVNPEVCFIFQSPSSWAYRTLGSSRA